MKQRKLLSLLCVVFALTALCLLVMPMQAEAVVIDSGKCGDNVTWSLSDSYALTISGTGAMNRFPWSPYDKHIKSVTIKSGVTEIVYSAFSGCNQLTAVSIPSTVTTIGSSAFYNCSNLKNLSIPSSVYDIGSSAFSGTAWLSAQKSVGGVIYAGKVAYAYEYSPEGAVTLRSDTTGIAGHAFWSDDITSITIPGTVKTIGDSAFENSALKSVKIPGSVKKIGVGAFHECANLTSVTIDSGVTSIGDYAFFNCAKLKTISIPSSVNYVGDKALHGTAWYGAQPVQTVIYAGKVAYGYIAKCPAKVTLKSDTTGIAPGAFSGATTLTSISIPNTVKTIVDSAFSGCSNLSSVTIPNSVKTIGNNAFYNCINLKTVTMGTGVETIGEWAFRHCDSLTGVYISDLAAWCKITFADSYANPLCSAEKLYLNNALVTDLKIPSGITAINDYAFDNCKNIISVTVPDSVKSIGNDAFYSCAGVTSVSIGNGVTTIGDEAFRGCSSLGTVTLGNNVQTIGYEAFGYCSLSNVTIPVSVKDIKNRAFCGYGSIGSLYYTGNQTQWKAITVGKDNERLTGATVHYNAGAITKQPSSVTVLKGQKATVSLSATGSGLTYKWYFKNKGESKFTLTTAFTGKSYSVEMNDARNGRQLYCVVTDSYGRELKSNVVTIKQAAVMITKQPGSVSTTSGKTATVSITASGEGLSYTWYVLNPGASSYVKSSITKSTYSCTMSSANNGRKVYCVVKDKFGNSLKSNVATMTMVAAAKITKQPVSVTVQKGKTATVSLTATGSGLTYKWYYKNKGETKFTLTTSFTGNTYSVEMTDARDGRQVYCVVTDKYGNTAKTNTVSLNKTYTGPEIVTQPKSVKGAVGAKLSTTVTATGKGLKYTWYVLDPGSATLVKSSVTSKTYSFTLTSKNVGRQVICIVIDQYGDAVSTNFVKFTKK